MKRVLLGTLAVLAAALLAACADRAEEAITPTEMQKTEVSEVPLPDSVLYYGEIRELQLDEEGKLWRLFLESPRSGPYLMLLGPDTVYVDSGAFQAFDPALLQEGEKVYIFHSPIAARSMPPQSLAFAVLRNIPMDISCGMYHKAEEIRKTETGTRILTDQKTLLTDGDTVFHAYDGEAGSPEDLQPGDFFLAWYQGQGEVHADHILVLPQPEK